MKKNIIALLILSLILIVAGCSESDSKEHYSISTSYNIEAGGKLVLDPEKDEYQEGEIVKFEVVTNNDFYTFDKIDGLTDVEIQNEAIEISKDMEIEVFFLEKSSNKLFVDFITGIQEIPVAEREAYMDYHYYHATKNAEFPVIDGSNVYFLYKGEANIVMLDGDINDWGRNGTIQMENIEGTDLYFFEREFEDDARIDYKFVVDGEYIFDPLNDKTAKSGWDANSELRMPGYPEQVETKYYEDISHGEIIRDLTISCEAIMGGNKVTQERSYHMYLPPNYDETKEYKVVYFHDGHDYVNNMETDNIFDYMIHHNEIEPVIGVFLEYCDRNEDYVYNQKNVYADFLKDEMIPYIDENYSTQADENGRVIVGFSNSGSFAVYASQRNPEIYNKVLSQSGALNCLYTSQGFGEDLGERIGTVDYPVKLFMVAGTYENWYSVNQRFYNSVKNNDTLIDLEYITNPQGHAINHWRDTLREGLIWLLNE